MLFFISSLFITIILFKNYNYKITENDIQWNNENFDIINPSFTINNDKGKISVKAKMGSFITDNEILLKNNVSFESNKFKIFSDEVTYNKVSQNAQSNTNSIFKSKKTKINSEGFNIKNNGDIIFFNGKTKLVLDQ